MGSAAHRFQRNVMIESAPPRLASRVDGSGPDLVLIHGVGSRADDWDAVVSRLSGRFRLIRFDLRGHGASDAPPGPYSIEQMVGDLIRVLDKHEAERPAIAGFSLGGLVAQGLAIAHPGRVSKLALLSTVAGRTDEERKRVQGRLGFIQTSHPADYFDQSVDRWFTPAFRDANPDVILRRKATVQAMDRAAYAAAYHVLAFTDFADDLHRISASTLVATGEHDIGSSPRMARLIASRIPNARLEIMDGLRHSILLEAPDRVAGLLSAFLADTLSEVAS
ncbi:MAG: alpha/beta fold hydrolase [Pseudomonadota bacterium]